MLFFSIVSQKEKFYIKKKSNIKSSCMILFFRILCRMNIFFMRFICLSKWYQNEYEQHIICYCPIKKRCKNEYNCKNEYIAFIWSSYHFNTPFCVILQYPQSKREILRQKENVVWTYILRGSLFIKKVSQ